MSALPPLPCTQQIKGTVLLMPSGSDRITSAPLQQLQSDKSVADEEVKALLSTRWATACVCVCMWRATGEAGLGSATDAAPPRGKLPALPVLLVLGPLGSTGWRGNRGS